MVMSRLQRSVRFEYDASEDYPYMCAGWLNVGGFNVGDRYTQEVGEVLIEAMRADGIKVDVDCSDKSKEMA